MNQNECNCSSAGKKHPPGTGSSWVVTTLKTPAGPVNRVATSWNRSDFIGAIKCRISGFRMSYTVEPGLYATGNPTDTSPVFVSANYKLSFDHLRRSLDTIDSWIIVLDTRGINVWCAAGKGTFGTDELINRITVTKLNVCVSARTVIVPQLGAPGVAAHEVKKATGFSVQYGPVRASDIHQFMRNNQKADLSIRQVRFPLLDRLVLTPMEFIPSLSKFIRISLIGAALLGIEKEGILFNSLYSNAFPLFIAGVIALVTGTFLTPVFLPFIPFRAFAVKGFITGLIAMAVYLPHSAIHHPLQIITSLLFFPLYSSFLTLNFTGSTPFTGISGVRKEMKYAVPLYFFATIISCLLLIIFKIQTLFFRGA